MSKLERMIELKPMKGDATEEVLVSTGHECSKCHGNGWFWHGETSDLVKRMCDRCHGIGRVKAVVTIKWRADINE